MNKKIGLIVAVVVIALGFFVSNLLSNQKEPVAKKPTPPTVSNFKFKDIVNKKENLQLEISGNLKSYNSVDLYAEVTGVAHSGKIEFREGAKFKKGDLLLKIDDTEYKNSVYSQKSSFINNLTLLIPDLKLDFPSSSEKWENYLNSFEIDKDLATLPEVTNEKEKYYITSKSIYTQYYSIKSLEARLAKYEIRAPFDGVITASSIKPETLVRASQLIGTFKNTSLYEMSAFARIGEVQMLKVGDVVTLESDDISGEFTSKISRINKSIDRSSQLVKVYILINDDRLIDGMYLRARANVQTKNPVVKIPGEAIFNAGSVWLNDNGKFKSQKIHIVHRQEDFAFVEGLQDGQIMLLNPDRTVKENKTIEMKNSQKKDK